MGGGHARDILGIRYLVRELFGRRIWAKFRGCVNSRTPKSGARKPNIEGLRNEALNALNRPSTSRGRAPAYLGPYAKAEVARQYLPGALIHEPRKAAAKHST